MSKMVPRESLDVLRNFVDVSLDIYGFDCTLYIPNNLDDIEDLDAYATPEDLTFDNYTTKTFIEWNPNIYKLKALGIYNEDQLPIIVYLPYQVTDGSNGLITVDILKHSYIKVPLEYVPANMQKYSEFEILTPIIHRLYDATIVQRYSAAPRRVIVEENRTTI